METLTEKIKAFLNVGCGYGYGDGCGYGYGYGDGSGDGCGYGCGYGSGDGYGYGCGSGYGYGSGDGCGIKSFNGDSVWNIDGIQTIIHEVHGNVAKGFILRNDLTLKPCFVVKQDNNFAHGETLHEAFESLQSKLFEDYPEEVRLQKFKESYPDFTVKIPAKELFEWHNRLTGSCLMGRRSFVNDKGIDIEADSFTVNEFISITENAYRGDIIRKLKVLP